jgi:large subunit ribosomal protein L9
MEVILLERVAKLGQMGETVKVRDGYARNFLLARGKALRATKQNKERFETQRSQLEARNLERRKEAETVGEKLNGQTFVVIRQSGETGVLYGSVSTRDLAEIITQGGFSVSRDQIEIAQPIKTLGLHTVPVVLHPEVVVNVSINIARSPEEAERQARGEAVTSREETNLDDLGLEVGAALAEAGGDDDRSVGTPALTGGRTASGT